MKRIAYIVITTLSLQFFITSCEKFLDKKQNMSLVTPGTLKDLQAILDDESSMNRSRTPSFGEASSDDYFLISSSYNALSERNKAVYRWMPYSYEFQNDWSINYFIIYNANLCLERLNKITRTTQNAQDWDNIKGSALFFRAYSFLNLAWVYAHAFNAATSDKEPGIVLRMVSDFNVPSSRSTVKETYHQIINDATEAIQFLPSSAAHVMRPSKGAAYGLLARSYLSMSVWDSAYKYSNLALAENNTLMDYNSSPYLTGFSENVPFKPFNPEIIFYSEMNNSLTLHAPLTGRVDPVLYSYYDTDDLRRKVYFRPANGYQRFKGSYSSNATTLFSGLAVNEMYLIKAESLARLNHIEDAMDKLNILLKTRWDNAVPFTPKVASDAGSAVSIILLERRKELLMRGLRWSDIKRLNRENAKIVLQRNIEGNTFSLQPNSSYFALPLPTDVILNSKIIQN